MTTYLVDSGHGGANAQGKSTASGLVGPGGLREKDVTLDLGKRVARYLGAGAAMTRAGDQNLSIAQRIDAARQKGADAFVSLHAGHGARGSGPAQVWVHPRAGRRSRDLARSIAQQFAHYGGGAGVQTGELAVLDPGRHDARTAACVVEVGQMSSPHGERQLRDPAFLDRMARAIADGTRAAAAYGRRATVLEDEQRLQSSQQGPETGTQGPGTEPQTIDDYMKPYRDIVDRAGSDDSFRQKLVSDPVQAFSEYGVAIPPDVASVIAGQIAAGVAATGNVTYPTVPSLSPEDLTAQLSPAETGADSAVAAALAEPDFSAVRTWAGVEVRLSHDACLKVEEGLDWASITAGVAAGVLGVLSIGPQGLATGPAAAIAGLVAALLAADRKILQTIDRGNGIRFVVPWTSLVPGMPPIAIPLPR